MKIPSFMRPRYPVLVVACVGCLFTFVHHASAQNWKQSTAPTNESWRAVASSADGSRIVAAGLGGIHISTNSGTTWTLTSAPGGQQWSSVASSADGARLAAVVDGGPIYISTNRGATWQSSDSPSNSWRGVACSGDGTRMVAVYGIEFSTGGIYISTNAGANWIASDSPTNGYGWYSVASSADGIKLAAMMVDALTPAGPYGWIYTSTNAGATWTQSTRMGWPSSLASSADGTKLVAAQGEFGPLGGRILTSTNSGATWEEAGAPSGAWASVASSADGIRLVAAIGGYFTGPITGPIYTATDSGATWTAGDSPTNDWVSVASSADGGKLVAAVNGGGIYTWQVTPAPMMNIALSGTNLLLSWTVPSKKFVLQQNTDLNTANWTDVPTLPTLNFTNLRFQVTVSPSLDRQFYRLKQQ